MASCYVESSFSWRLWGSVFISGVRKGKARVYEKHAFSALTLDRLKPEGLEACSFFVLRGLRGLLGLAWFVFCSIGSSSARSTIDERVFIWVPPKVSFGLRVDCQRLTVLEKRPRGGGPGTILSLSCWISLTRSEIIFRRRTRLSSNAVYET